MKKDFFQDKASSYEKNRSRVTNVENISLAIRDRITLNPDMEIVDFGSGTGLLLEQIAPSVKHITAVDISKAMIEQLESKRSTLPCELEILELDLSQAELPRTFDGIISSMTMHHIEDIPAMFYKFHRMLRAGGFIAIADLDTEDGSFHQEDTGVFHHGFDRENFSAAATAAGFKLVEINNASIIEKPQGNYPVFLLTGSKG